MPNHVHLILAPADSQGLALAMARAHRLYAGYVNARARQTGHLFQGRFGSVAMDADHLMVAARYVALNPVRARLVKRAQDWSHGGVGAIWPGATTPWSACARCSSARPALPICSTASPTRLHLRHCAAAR